MLQYYIMHAFSISADILLNKLPLKNYIHFNFKDLFLSFPCVIYFGSFLLFRGGKKGEKSFKNLENLKFK